jgi:hypothetical protein
MYYGLRPTLHYCWYVYCHNSYAWQYDTWSHRLKSHYFCFSSFQAFSNFQWKMLNTKDIIHWLAYFNSFICFCLFFFLVYWSSILEWLFLYNWSALGIFQHSESISQFKNVILTTQNCDFVKIYVAGFNRK